MSGTFNSPANAVDLSDALNQDPSLKGVLYSRALEVASGLHNDFEQFTSVANKNGLVGTTRSIFAKRRDLAAGGASKVNFNVIGPPGGNGVMGGTELTGNTSRPSMATYSVDVGWHRDAVEFTQEMIDMLSAGKEVPAVAIQLLGKKMGVKKRNHMMMTLIKKSDPTVNVYRPNNRATVHDLRSTDVLGTSIANESRSRLGNMGATPIAQKLSSTGSQINGYLTFGTATAFLPLRNDPDFQLALARGDSNGRNNALFTGELIPWAGMPWYEMTYQDEKWDDYIGTPIEAKAKIAVGFSNASAAGNCILKGATYLASPTPGTQRYFQFFDGHAFKFQESDTPAADSNEYYAWAVNPDGSVCFLSYLGSGNNGNSIVVNKILALAAGTSTKGNNTVGQLTTNGSTGFTGGSSNLPTGYNYTSTVQAGAMLFQANSRGVLYGRGFQFGSMAAAFGEGSIQMSQIEQKRDYDFVHGRGYQMVFGTGLCLDPFKKPTGYMLLEYAITQPGYNVPNMIEA